MRKKILFGFLACVLVMSLDFALGRAATFWVDYEYKQVTKNEQQIRCESAVYHHGLKPKMDRIIAWGPRRYHLITNSLGFRDFSEREVPLETDRYRILLIGDSFTEGLGVEYSKTYAGLITKQLDKSGIQVLNAACVTYSPTIYLRKVQDLLEKGLRFNELVVFLDVSDIADETEYFFLDDKGNVGSHMEKLYELTQARRKREEEAGIALPTRSKNRTSSLMQTLQQNSLLMRFSFYIYFQIFPKPPVTNFYRSAWTQIRESYINYAVKGLPQASRRMTDLLNLLRDRGIRMTVVIYPWPDQLTAKEKMNLQEIYWTAWSFKNGVSLIDCFPNFRKKTVEESFQYYIRDDMHFNEKGHALMADIILARTQERLAKLFAKEVS